MLSTGTIFSIHEKRFIFLIR